MEKISLESSEVVAFDFFDTLVHRKYHPEIVLYKWSKRMSELLDFNIESSEFYALRKKVEKESKKDKKVEEVSYYNLVENVYYGLTDAVKSMYSLKEFVNLSIKVESKIELEAIYINPEIKDVFEDAVSQRKKIVIISDFYCGEELIKKILTKLKIESKISKIFVSSDYNARKSTGNLYNKVLDVLNIEPSDMMMIGDNIESDYNIPRRLGIKSIHLKYVDTTIKYEKKELENYLFNEMFVSNVDRPFNGYTGSIVLFISKLYQELVKKKCKSVLFCSREGQLLKKLFDIYQDNINSPQKIASHYFFVSRRSTMLPALKKIGEEKFEKIFRQFTTISISDFLFSIGFNKEEMRHIINSSKIRPETIIIDKVEDVNLKKILENEEFVKIYDAKRICQKKYFFNYVKSMNDDMYTDGINIVDIGWKGTIQDNIEEALDHKVKVNGFYFGLNIPGNSGKIFDNKEGIVFSNVPKKSKNFNVFTKDYMIYERIFVANHGSVLGYTLCSDSVIPELSSNESEIEIYQYVEKFQKDLIRSFIRLIEAFEKSKWTPVEFAFEIGKLTLWQDCVNFPRLWEYELNMRNKSKENFGNISKNYQLKKKKISINQLKKIDFLYVDYAYRIPQKAGLKFLYPASKIYCRLVYLLNRLFLKK